ncbi:MAG: hypothetical protein VYB73_05835 [Verrucomicrobiota bacterium]|nr:hypothetical protein [Verrucomicrobiota bacterium]
MPSSKKKKVLMHNFGYKIIILILTGTMLTLWLRGNIQIGSQSNYDQKSSKKEPTTTPPPLDKTEIENNTVIIKEDIPAKEVTAADSAPAPPNPATTEKPEKSIPSSEPKTREVSAIPNDEFIVSEQDRKILEIIEIGSALRKKGETLESLRKLREAKKNAPQNPRIMWELYLTYESMSLQQKAGDELKNIMDLGEDKGGEYYQIIKLKTDPNSGSGKKNKSARFLFGSMLTDTGPQGEGGESVNVRMEIVSTINEPIDTKDISLVVDFYDLVNGNKVERTRADPPSATWITKPINWQTSNIEIVNWNYHMPELSQEEIKNFGKRSYHGFVARLYYKDIIQDIYAEPRILLEPKKLDVDSFIEGSLFPN